MIWQKLRKVGNGYIATIPKEEIERQHLEEGSFWLSRCDQRKCYPLLHQELREAFEESWNAMRPHIATLLRINLYG